MQANNNSLIDGLRWLPGFCLEEVRSAKPFETFRLLAIRRVMVNLHCCVERLLPMELRRHILSLAVWSNSIPRSLSDICCGLDARKRVRATVGRVRLRGNMWEV